MIQGLKPYDNYMRTAMVWAGYLPSHWSTPRMKHILRERSQKGFAEEPLLAATQTKGVVKKEEYENRTVLALKDLHLLKLVCEGDFVISLRSFQGGIEYARHRGIISPAYTILYPERPSDHGYLAWLFKSRPYIENLTLHVTGIRQGQNIDYDRLRRSQIPLPPPDEQAAIVRFLDHADRRIRRYIRAKRQLIALLKEERHVFIRSLLTAGIHPSRPTKPSGADWLGDVPDHWTVLKGRYFLRLFGCSVSDRLVGEGTGTPYYKVEDLNADVAGFRLDVGSSRYSVTSKEGPQPLAAPLLMIPKRGGAIATNKVRIAREPALFDPNIMGIRTTEKCLPEFLAYILMSRGLWDIADVSSVPQINNKHIYPLTFALPPIVEQRAILCTIESFETQNLRLQSTAESSMKAMIELRNKLVADVVTGKLDIREVAAGLPEEVEDTGVAADELLDDDSIDEAELDTEPEEVEA